MKSVGILIAMWEELNPLRKHWKLEWTGPGDFFTGKFNGTRIQVALSGVGPKRARQAMQPLLKYGKPELLISLGYSGALKAHLKPGDALLAHTVETQDGRRFTSSGGSARLLCVSRLAPTADSKRRLAEQHPEADAVDMESSVLAEAAEEAGVPWQALRIVIDPLDSALPIDFNRCVNGKGQTQASKLAREIVTNPHKLPALLEFARWESLAKKQLIEASTQLLTCRS